MSFGSWMDKVGTASNNEEIIKMKWIKKLIYAKYHVMHPMNEVRAFKSLPHRNSCLCGSSSCQMSYTNCSHVLVLDVLCEASSTLNTLNP